MREREWMREKWKSCENLHQVKETLPVNQNGSAQKKLDLCTQPSWHIPGTGTDFIY